MRAGDLTRRLQQVVGLSPIAAPVAGYRLARVNRAAALTSAWDRIAGYYFQRRVFLELLERSCDFNQRYYELRDAGGTLVGGAVLCTLRVDVLTYLGIRSPLDIDFVAIPCSQPAPGLLGAPEMQRCTLERVVLEEPGFLVGLNLDHPLDLPPVVETSTLPAVVLDRSFASFDDYLWALRSPYRRRLKQIMASFAGVVIERGPCSRFDDEMYRLYRSVLARSSAKLETLTQSFFQQLPPEFALTSYRRDGRLIAWHISLLDGDRFYFFLEGHEPETEPNLYFNILAGVLREAFERHASAIELGQTAEVPKMRLGGRLAPKGMFGTHPSRGVRAALRLGRPLLGYSRRVPTTHVFHA
ncbi:MAG: GNAT family N-acetyltransferase [Deltaproteobacteria bacterium]|nr:GNAT family N-acetyltransferase [Deltaproteobacteria bacterium]